ncbi:MAG: hypothetical protein ACI87I_001669 [Pseudoalteromonas tetraodonis]|jgi:hypothetical protein
MCFIYKNKLFNYKLIILKQKIYTLFGLGAANQVAPELAKMREVLKMR